MKIQISLSNYLHEFHAWVDRLEDLLKVKFHPMGAGSEYLKNGMATTVTAEQAKKIKRELNSQGWRALVVSAVPKPARTDGVWLGSINALNTPGDNLVPLVFVSKPESNGIIRVLLKMRKPFPALK